MAEYSDYDDSLYDNFDHTKGKKIRSWISVIISVLFLISVVIFVIVRMPQNVRTKFDTVTGSEHLCGENLSPENNEFYKLNKAFENDETLKIDDNFIKQYPNVYAMISQSKKDIAKNKVSSFDDNNVFTIAQSYVLKEDSTATTSEKQKNISGTIGTDMVIIPYSSTVDGIITVNTPVRFSLRYFHDDTAGINYISGNYVKSDSFRLNFYTMSVKLISGAKENIKAVKVNLKLNDALSKAQAEDKKLYSALTLTGGDEEKSSMSSGGTRGDFNIEKQLAAGDISTTSTVVTAFDDTMYKLFSSLDVYGNKNDRFTISLN